MKKLIGLLVIMFVTIGVFGQKFIRSFSFIEATPTGNNTIEDWIHVVGDNGDYDWVLFVHFVQNGKLYLLSYEPKEDRGFGGCRDIYLYSKDTSNIDSPWEKASPFVMTNVWIDSYNYNEVDFFRSELSRGSEGKVVIEDNCVKMTIGWEVMTNGGIIINEPVTFTFTPTGNNFYKVDGGKGSSI